MSSTAPRGPAPDAPSGVRPLPPKPSLEFERRAAKKLLDHLQRGDPAALERAAARTLRPHGDEGGFRLADAQFIIAREYGFRSWPRLVEYFTTLERHERSELWSIKDAPECERTVQWLLADFRRRSIVAGTLFVNFLPRFFGMPVADVFDAEITEDDARLVVARHYLAPSWDALIERTKHNPRDDSDDWNRYETPLGRARHAIQTGNLDQLAVIIDAHPDLLDAPPPGDRYAPSLISLALHTEHRAVVGNSARGPSRPSLVTAADARRVTDWLIARGADPTLALNRALLGHAAIDTSAASVEFWLARGADPEWMPPNGIPVLEYALYTYRSGEAVDVLARRVTPREGLWIAAGLGDLRALDRCIVGRGRLTPAASRTRPDFAATGRFLPTLPDADDLELMWEAFCIAALNQRFAAMDRLLEAGFPIGYSKNFIVLMDALQHQSLALVEYLIARGVDLASPQWSPGMSALDGAQMMLRSNPADLTLRRIVELLGGDPDAVTAPVAETPGEPEPNPHLLRILESASNAARLRGRASIEPDEILAAMLRGERKLIMVILTVAGANMARLRATLGDRLDPIAPSAMPQLPLSDAAQAAMDVARAHAIERRRSHVDALGVLRGLASVEDGPVADLLRDAESSPERLREALGKH